MIEIANLEELPILQKNISQILKTRKKAEKARDERYDRLMVKILNAS